MIPPPRATKALSTKDLLFRLQIKGISTWRRS
jgi:formate dehydrogenase